MVLLTDYKHFSTCFKKSSLREKTISALRYAGINVFGELYFWSDEALLQVRNFNKAALREVDKCMRELGLPDRNMVHIFNSEAAQSVRWARAHPEGLIMVSLVEEAMGVSLSP